MKTIVFFLCVFFCQFRAWAQKQVHLGFSTNWDYGIGMPENDRYVPYASGQISSFSFDLHLEIPIKFLRITPSFSTSIPLRTLRLTNNNGQSVPNGYNISLPYDDGPGFSYYLQSEDYESRESFADIYQSLLGAFAGIQIGGNDNHVNLSSGLFLRKKRAIVYTPIVYDEYEWYSSTGTEWDNYFYSDTYDSFQSRVETLKENSLAVPLMIEFCHHWGTVYSGTSFVYYLNRDPWMSFRYSMGIAF